MLSHKFVMHVKSLNGLLSTVISLSEISMIVIITVYFYRWSGSLCLYACMLYTCELLLVSGHILKRMYNFVDSVFILTNKCNIIYVCDFKKI